MPQERRQLFFFFPVQWKRIKSRETSPLTCQLSILSVFLSNSSQAEINHTFIPLDLKFFFLSNSTPASGFKTQTKTYVTERPRGMQKDSTTSKALVWAAGCPTTLLTHQREVIYWKWFNSWSETSSFTGAGQVRVAAYQWTTGAHYSSLTLTNHETSLLFHEFWSITSEKNKMAAPQFEKKIIT